MSSNKKDTSAETMVCGMALLFIIAPIASIIMIITGNKEKKLIGAILLFLWIIAALFIYSTS